MCLSSVAIISSDYTDSTTAFSEIRFPVGGCRLDLSPTGVISRLHAQFLARRTFLLKTQSHNGPLGVALAQLHRIDLLCLEKNTTRILLPCDVPIEMTFDTNLCVSVKKLESFLL